jgi:AcrR family transcriptional regulator
MHLSPGIHAKYQFFKLISAYFSCKILIERSIRNQVKGFFVGTQAQIERKEQIVIAARDVFACQGYSKASIKKIAKQAGLNSPALIYWYFDNKADLFAAVLSQASQLLHEIGSNQELENMALQDALEILAKSFIDTFECPSNKHIFRILISESSNNPDVSDHFAQAVILPVRDFLVPFFQRKMDQGLLRRHDPQISARVFAGTLVHTVLCDELFPQVWDCQPLSDGQIKEVVSIFLEGLNNTDPPAGSTQTPDG